MFAPFTLALAFSTSAFETSAFAMNDAAAEVTALCQRLAQTKAYSFECRTEADRPARRRRHEEKEREKGEKGAKGRSAQKDDPREEPLVPVSGQVQEGSPIRVVRGAIEGFRQGERLVYRRDRSDFERYDPAAFLEERPAERGRARKDGKVGEDGDADQSGEESGATGGAKGGNPTPTAPASAGTMVPGGIPPGGAFRFALMRQLSEMAAAPAPHELLARVATTLTDVRREEVDGGVAYSGSLPSAMAAELSGLEQLRRNSKQFGGKESGSFQAQGTLRILVGASGEIERLTIETKVQGRVEGGEGAEAQSRHVEITLKDFDATSYAVPREALSLLKD